MTFKKCSLKAGITSEDMTEIRQYIQSAGNDAQGVQDYLDGIDADLNDLRNQTGTQLVTEQVETPGEAITGDVVDMIKGLADGPSQISGTNPFLFEFDPGTLTETETDAKDISDYAGDSSKPITVTEKGGDFLILDGHHRVKIALESGEKVRAIVIPYKDVQALESKGVHQADMRKEWISTGAYEAAKGLKPNVLNQAQDPLFSEDNRLTNIKPTGAMAEAITRENPGVKLTDKTATIYRVAVGGELRFNDYVALNKDIADAHMDNLRDRGESDASLITKEVPLSDLMMANDATEFIFVPQDQEEISQEAREKILNKNNVDRGLKAPKSARFWRGIGENSGSAGATYGTGLYVARSKTEAKEYAGKSGKLHEMDRSDLPQDPLRFSSIMDYQNWLNRATDSMGMKGPREFNAKYPDVREFIQVLDPAIDGIQIGTGSDSIFVNYGGRKLFEQEGKKEPRGQIAILPDSAVIKLYDSANLSTFLHESGHLFLEMTGKLYDHAKATPEIKADGDAILSFLGAESFDKITVDQHEKWARAQEKYFGEGKAPSLELQDSFRRFAQWLKHIYKSLTNLNVELSDDIREVMDRMLATDEQIDRLKGNFKPLFEDAKDAGMTKAEFKAYEGNAAPEAAKEELFKKLVKELRRQETKKWKDEKESLQSQIIEKLEEMPVYSAENNMRKDGIKLSTDEIKAVIPGAIPKRLRGLSATDGKSAEELAPIFGFASGEEMISNIAKSKPIKQQASDIADLEMMARHGDALNDGRIEEEAELAMRNDSRAKKLLSELRALSRKSGSPAIDRVSLREYAKTKVAKTKVSSLYPAQYRAAEIRSARAAATAKAKGDLDGAQKAKTQEIINFYLGKEASLAKGQAEKIRASHKVIQTKKYDPKKYNNDPYVSKAKLLIRVFDFRKTSRTDEALNKAELEVARQWIESQQVKDPDKASPYLVQAEILGRLIPYREMTVEDIQGLDDTIQSLMKAARETSSNQAKIFKEEMGALSGEVIKNRIVTYETEMDGETPYAMVRKLGDGITSSLRKLDSLVRQIDAFKEQGPVWKKIIKPLLDASNTSLTMKNTAGEDLKEIFKGYEGALGSTLLGDLASDAAIKAGASIDDKKITFTFESGQVQRLSYGARLSVALNMGNDGNYEALTSMTALPLTDGDVNSILDTLTDRDMDLVQNIWDYIDTYWAQAAELEKARSGAAPIKVAPRSFTTPSGRAMKGGYYPLSKDPAEDVKLGDIDTQHANFIAGGAVSKATKTGSLIERTKFGGHKINFSVNVVFNHIDGVIHDLSHWQAVHDVNRVLSNHKVQGELKKSIGVAGVKAIEQRLIEVAAGPQRMDALTWWERPLRYARLATTYKALGYSVSTSIKNVAGLTTAVPEVGAANIAEAIAEWTTSPSKVRDFILSRSEYMIERGQVINRDIAQIRASIKTDSKLNKFKDYSFWFMTQTDKAVTRPIWMAAYKKGQGMFETEAEVIDYADQTVRRTQGSGDTMDLSNVETRSELMRTMTIMYSAMNAMYNIAAEQRLRYMARGIEGAGSITEWQYFTNIMSLTVGPGILMGLLALSDDDDEPEKVAKHFAWEVAGQTLGLVPILRDAYSLKRYNSSFPSPLVDLITAPVTLAEQATEGELDKSLLRAVTGTAAWLHIPGGSQANRTGGYIIDMMDGEIDSFSPWELVVTGKE